ncbi:hypothetical protein C5167_024924 [Papaver somniferum]|uniref:Uncharacterized protein n=1 Tax=Papaver somniferum TaxID=3469 RepID=A0A4Y7JSX9_PAPSO|nr:hypothetical protein C5167_024924 [Papaver somniferum]
MSKYVTYQSTGHVTSYWKSNLSQQEDSNHVENLHNGGTTKLDSPLKSAKFIRICQSDYEQQSVISGQSNIPSCCAYSCQLVSGHIQSISGPRSEHFLAANDHRDIAPDQNDDGQQTQLKQPLRTISSQQSTQLHRDISISRTFEVNRARYDGNMMVSIDIGMVVNRNSSNHFSSQLVYKRGRFGDTGSNV